MTNYCPTSFIDTLDRTKSLGCNEKYKYHCMRNKKDEMVEKCLEFSWMQKDECAVYDTDAQKIDAWPCNIIRGVCPKQHYLSNEVMSYSACVPLLPTGNSTNGSQLESNGVSISTVIIIVIICIGVIALGVAVLIHFRRKRRGHENKDEENTVPLFGRDSLCRNDEEEEKTKHLEMEEKNIRFFECKGECTEYMLETIKEHLQNNVNVFIIGKPGSGKTTLAWTVCKHLHGHVFGDQMWYVKASTCTRNLPNEEEMTLILLLDGRFESAWTTEGTFDKVLNELDELRNKLTSKNMLTIATLSHEAYDRISRYPFVEKLKPFEIIDLDIKENALSISEMIRMLETHGIHIRNVNEADDSKCLSLEKLRDLHLRLNRSYMFFWIHEFQKIGFPLIADLMSRNPLFLGNTHFIQKPITYVLESIKQLLKSGKHADRNKYCTIVYASWNWGYIDEDNVDQVLLNKIGKNHGHPEAEIDTDFYVLRKRTDTVYEFLHESLLRAFLAAYGSQNMGFVIEHCPLHVLLEYSVSNTDNISRKEKMLFLTICGIHGEKALFRRIIDEKVDIRHHMMWNGIKMDFMKRESEEDVHRENIRITPISYQISIR